MFRKILIANRGAIACRILRTVKAMGLGAVAVYSDIDENAPHVRDADEAIRLGPAAAAESYLHQQRILDAARRTGAEAIHPGYGFLSENAAFAEECERAGITFIGPTPAQLRDFGLKHTARELAQRCGLPLLAGTDLLRDLPAALAAAEPIGYPVSRSTAGAVARARCNSAEPPDSFAAVASPRATWQRGCFEKLRAAHQCEFGDGPGCGAFGERDCSVRRPESHRVTRLA